MNDDLDGHVPLLVGHLRSRGRRVRLLAERQLLTAELARAEDRATPPELRPTANKVLAARAGVAQLEQLLDAEDGQDKPMPGDDARLEELRHELLLLLAALALDPPATAAVSRLGEHSASWACSVGAVLAFLCGGDVAAQVELLAVLSPSETLVREGLVNVADVGPRDPVGDL